jgi:hypothetical protein
MPVGQAGPGRGGVVLLSPGAPGFGQFRDYRDRGEDLRPRHARHFLNHPTGNDPPNPTPVTSNSLAH